MASNPTATNQSVAQLYVNAARLAPEVAVLSTAPRPPFAQPNRTTLVEQATSLLKEVLRIGDLTTNPEKGSVNSANVAVAAALQDVDTINLPEPNSLKATDVFNRFANAIVALEKIK